ncbi:hypothetical protein JQ038_03045 [Clostridium botulinum]|nr:hypothetical protein [Clostridium botulinum]MCS4475082.1 hypothetical protein [Clostridium botulinum]MCS4480451.1 hypothetical protein [Clostridium botulinum]MCS4481945.1 hypothetical protein [Clostridium botulinum]
MHFWNGNSNHSNYFIQGWEKCIKCINFRKNGPEGVSAKNCIVCGHCEAICPIENLIDLVDIAYFASIGSNLQGVSYIIVDYKNLLNKDINLTIKELASNSFIMIRFHHYIQSYHNKEIDTVLRGVPCLILATADVN